MPWKIYLNAVGDQFKPSTVNLPLIDALDVGALRRSGRFKGQPSPYGIAGFGLPMADDSRDKLLEFCSDALHAKEAMRSAGATDFTVWILREYEKQCNEEFQVQELEALVKLQCTVCYSAWDTAEEERAHGARNS